MAYQIIASSRFGRDFRKLDRTVQKRMRDLADILREEPYIGKLLKGDREGRYSLRIGDYRVIYLVDEAKKSIYLVTIQHRRRVYRS